MWSALNMRQVAQATQPYEGNTVAHIRRALKPQDTDHILADAFNDSDVEMAIALFEHGSFEWGPPPDGVAQASAGNGFKGLMDQLAGPDTRMDMVVHYVTEAHGLALLRSQWQIVRSNDGHDEIVAANDGIEVVRKQDNGEWLYVIDHPWGAAASWSTETLPRRDEQAPDAV